MSEAESIANSEQPATRQSIAKDLTALGLAPDMTVMVHSSLSRLGFVVGGAQAVVEALLHVLGPGGTLMMPTHSGALSDPASWRNPPVPESWWQPIRDEMPAFDQALTPTREMGSIVDCFLHVPGVRRSNHPTVSAAAFGPNTAALLEDHNLTDRLGESSPQGKLYGLDGHVLLLGVDHGNNTSLHLAEVRSGVMPTVEAGAPIMVDGERQWVDFSHVEDDDSDFAELGEAFALTGGEAKGSVGSGVARLVRSRDVVDFGVDWIRSNRTAPS